MAGAKRTFVTLDGLRGIAALAVLTNHASLFFTAVSVTLKFDDSTNSQLTIGPFFESYLAVDFFFGLSGFVLAHAYGQRLSQGMSAIQFMMIRLIRLYPLYILALAIVALIESRQLAHGGTTYLQFANNFIPAILFLPSPSLNGDSVLFPTNGPAWSLFFELAANLCFALTAATLSNFKLGLTVLSAGLILVGTVSFGYLGFGTSGGAMDAGFDWQSFGGGLVRVAYSFFAGVLIYRIWCIWRPPFKIPSAAVVLVLIGILVAHPSEQYQAVFDIVVTIAIFPALIWLGADTAPTGLMAAAFSWLGTASYAVYVLQVPLYGMSVTVLRKIFGDTNDFGLSYGVLFAAFVFVVAIVADRYVDRPLRSFLTKRLVQTIYFAKDPSPNTATRFNY
jgi:peptidoglycan/LPS O-acetylase OafA/YrhL